MKLPDSKKTVLELATLVPSQNKSNPITANSIQSGSGTFPYYSLPLTVGSLQHFTAGTQTWRRAPPWQSCTLKPERGLHMYECTIWNTGIKKKSLKRNMCKQIRCCFPSKSSGGSSRHLWQCTRKCRGPKALHRDPMVAKRLNIFQSQENCKSRTKDWAPHQGYTPAKHTIHAHNCHCLTASFVLFLICRNTKQGMHF